MDKAVEQKGNVVSEKTLIPVSLLIVIISALSLGVIRVESIASDTRSVAMEAASLGTEISNLKLEDKEIKNDFNKTLTDLNTRLARIEGALNIKEQK